jgi:hypothetical protein
MRLIRDRSVSRILISSVPSTFGAEATGVLLPLVAVISLHASPFEVGALSAALSAPFVILSLVVGAWLDRSNDLVRVVTWSQILRAVILGGITLAAVGQSLTIALMFGAMALFGTLNVIYSLALRILVFRASETNSSAVNANATLEAARQVISVGGPAAAGGVAALVGPPQALIISVVCFLASAMLYRGRHDERAGTSASAGLPSRWRTGLTHVLRTPVLRLTALEGAWLNTCYAAAVAVLPVHLVRVVHLNSAQVGLYYAYLAMWGLIASSVSKRALNRLTVVSFLLVSAVLLFVPVMVVSQSGDGALSLPALAIGGITAAGLVLLNVLIATVPKVCASEADTGKVLSAVRFFSWSGIALGGLLGGLLATAFGSGAALLVVAAGGLVVPLLLAIPHGHMIRQRIDVDST